MRAPFAGALKEALQDIGSSSVVVSRLASPDLRTALASSDARAIPAVGGRAVWTPDASAVSVVEWPGWLGQPERRPPAPSVSITAAGTKPDWSSTALIAGGLNGYIRVEPDWTPDPDAVADYAQRTSGMRRVVAHLSQAQGIVAAWPVRSPRALLLMPSSPTSAVAACPPPAGLAVTALAQFPEFPGGLRFHMQTFAGEIDLRSWAAEFINTLTSGEHPT